MVWNFNAPGMPHHRLLWERKGDVEQIGVKPCLMLPTL
jgi:hypothetical protein